MLCKLIAIAKVPKNIRNLGEGQIARYLSVLSSLRDDSILGSLSRRDKRRYAETTVLMEEARATIDQYYLASRPGFRQGARNVRRPSLYQQIIECAL